jgi:hypothetical protein
MNEPTSLDADARGRELALLNAVRIAVGAFSGLHPADVASMGQDADRRRPGVAPA